MCRQLRIELLTLEDCNSRRSKWLEARRPGKDRLTPTEWSALAGHYPSKTLRSTRSASHIRPDLKVR